MEPPRVIVIAGPTASGKSALAAALAEALGGAVVNADSRQVYRELEIGVAKPTPAERARAPHYLVDYVSIHEPYSAGRWSRDARAVLDEVFAAAGPRHRVAVVSGGSGLHVRALVEGIPAMPTVPPGVRAAVEQVLAEAGIAGLQRELAERDPAYYEVVDRDNPHRLMRALAVIRSSGKTFTELRAAPRTPLPYPVSRLVLDPPRAELYARCDARVLAMVERGLEAEARALYAHRALDALQTIGYREWWPYIEGEESRAGAIEAIQRATRRYARRQATWNRKLPGTRLAAPDLGAALEAIGLSSRG